MSASWLESRRDGRLLRLTLNRPEKRNALNLALCRELTAAVEQADADPSIGAVLLAGSGSAFCAGMDLSETLSPEAAALAPVHEQLFTLGMRVATPIIAAVQGPALAGGTGLVANAHLVVASESATFGLTEIKIGLWPFLVFRAVVLAIGERRAVELSLTGRTINAVQAAQIGLIHEVTATAELDRRATEVAAGIAGSSPSAIQSGLRFVAECRGRSWSEGGAIAQRFREELFRSGDFAEGVRAFHEKRLPRWPSAAGE